MYWVPTYKETGVLGGANLIFISAYVPHPPWGRFWGVSNPNGQMCPSLVVPIVKELALKFVLNWVQNK